jgi:hypothetical protein
MALAGGFLGTTSLQCVFFYDRGTVAETQDDLWKESADSKGAGFKRIAGYANS